MQRHLIFAGGIACYLASIAALVYLFLFIGNIGIENSIDAPARMHWLPAAAIDFALLLTFALPHSALARPSVKNRMTRFVAPAMQRSVYVLLTSLSFLLLFGAWQPLEYEIWHVESGYARGILYGMFVFGWLTILVAISLTNHFDLFGIRQAWSRFRQRPYQRLNFTTRWLYRYVRHPLYLGWLFAFWAAPIMTAGHLLFALTLSAYIVIAIPWEENDLIAEFGKRYADYRERVPKLIPSIPVMGGSDVYVLDETGRYVGPEDLNPRA